MLLIKHWYDNYSNDENDLELSHIFKYSKTCVRQPPLKLPLAVDVERWLSYKGTCHVILLAKLHDIYLYKTDTFFHINHCLKSISKVALFHRFYCMLEMCACFRRACGFTMKFLSLL